jgi:hypothetical protein
MHKDNLIGAAGDTVETARDFSREAIDKGREAVDKGIDRGYDRASEYLSKGIDYAGEASNGLAELVQRQPWLALAGAFVIGYVAAKVLRQMSL